MVSVSLKEPALDATSQVLTQPAAERPPAQPGAAQHLMQLALIPALRAKVALKTQ
jgi:hypothetical protein